MPIYEYECYDCGKRFEKIQKLGDEPIATCMFCGGEVKKCVSIPAISFKGKGFYCTDYSSKSKSSEASSGSTGLIKSESKKDVASENGGKTV